MSEIWERSASELAAALRDREFSSREAVDVFLDRIADSDLNAVVTLDPERARREAERADDALAAGDPTGPLHGVPMTVKDVFETGGMRTTGGADEWREHVPDRDADAVARLRDAGAIILGKTNTPAYGLDLQTFNDLFGTTRHPDDPDRTPGGSSGGAAAALAAGLTPLELGSDHAGSIRLPAGWCGVVGHKPSFGVVPTRGHVPPRPGARGTGDVLVAGPMARTVADARLAFELLAGPAEPGDRGWRLDLPTPVEDARLTVGVWLDDPMCPVATEVREITKRAVDRLADAGIETIEVSPGFDSDRNLELAFTLTQAVVGAGLPPEVYDGLLDMAEQAGEDPSMLERAAAWMTIRHRDWLRASERRRHHRAAFEQSLDDAGVDVLLAPVTPVPAIRHLQDSSFFERTIEVDGDTRPYAHLAAWSIAVGALHLPATAVPVGRTASGLPVGVQLVGRLYADLTCLAASKRVEEALS